MKVDEIANTYGGGINLNRIVRDGEDRIGSIDNYELMLNYNDDVQIFYILNENIPIAAVVGETATIATNYFIIRGVYVEPAFRGKLLGSSMYNFIMHYTQANLMSDTSQTSGGKSLWQTISKTHKVGVFDIAQGKIVSNNINDAYHNDDENLVLVTTNTITDSIIIPTFKKRK